MMETTQQIIEEALDAFEKRHPPESVKSPLQKLISHWLTIVITTTSIGAAMWAGVVHFNNISEMAFEVPLLKEQVASIEGRSVDFDRLTQEAKEHRDDNEIHMSKDEKKLLFIEASKPLEQAITEVERSLDRLAIEQRESIKRQERMADQIEKMVSAGE